MWSEVGMQLWSILKKAILKILKDYENLYDNSPNYFVVENVTEPVLIITGEEMIKC